MSARRLLAAATLLFATVLTAAALLAAAAWQALAARGDAPAHTLRLRLAGRTVEHRVDVATLLRVVSHPLAAQLVDGRHLDTAHGRWQLAATADGQRRATCAPCRIVVPALGPQPLRIERAELAWRAEGADAYRGSLAIGRAVGRTKPVLLEGQLRIDRRGALQLQARLPETSLADVVDALGSELPERDAVRVRGTLALVLQAQFPQGPWRIEPRVEGFEVDGLDTQRFADLQRPAACRVDAQAGVPTVTGWLPRAVIAAEDARFFEHPGYDLRAMVDALQHNQRGGVPLAGASTLTQQLAKRLVAGDERSPARKLRELLYAVEMERTLGKARILQTYLALAPWGDGVCGAERAVRVHLGQRDPSTLGPVAAAWLASLLTAPDAHLGAEAAAGDVDHARVARVLDAMRPMSAQRREQARLQLLFWTPPALARLRMAMPAAAAAPAPSPAPEPQPGHAPADDADDAPTAAAAMKPAVAPAP